MARATAVYLLAPLVLLLAASLHAGAPAQPPTPGTAGTPGTPAPTPEISPGTQPAEAAPTCAVLADPAGGVKLHDLAALLEIGLSQSGRVRLLERAAISKVIGEQELELALQGDEDRVRIGRLLRAQALVLLRPAKTTAGDDALDVIVSETGRGLRLLHLRVAMPQEADLDVPALAQMVLDPVLRSGQPIGRVCAVFPFLNKDLTTEHDDLRAAYTRVAEQALISDPSVALVSVEDADATAKELKVTGQKQMEAHEPPLYFVGEFRNKVVGETRSVQLKITARRGQEVIHEIDVPVPPEHAARLVYLTVQDALLKAGGKKLPPADPAAQVAQLTSRAALFQRLGNWTEAFDLYNASLLINYDQEQAQAGLLEVILRLAGDPYAGRKLSGAEQAQARRRAWDYWRHGQEHIEWLIRHDEALRNDGAGPGKRMLWRRWIDSYLFASPRTIMNDKSKAAGAEDEIDVHELYANRRATRDLLTKSLGRSVPRGRHALPEILGALMSCGPEGFDEPPPQFLAAAERMILAAVQFEDLPGMAWGVTSWFHGRGMVDGKPRPEFAAMMQRLLLSNDKRFKAAGQEMARKLDEINHPPPPTAAKEPEHLPPGDHWAAALGPAVRLEHLELTVPQAPNAKDPLRLDPWGWVDGGPGLDIVYDRHMVCLLGQTQRLDPVYVDDAPQDNEPWSAAGRGVQWPCFDGKLVWVPRAGPTPLLLIINPATGKKLRFTASDGLPPMDRAASSAALAPGHVLLAGSFAADAGTVRAWIAEAKLNEETGKLTVDVFHEAKEIVTNYGRPNANVGCRVARMLTLTDPAKPAVQRVIVGRMGPDFDGALEALQIDPAKRQVSVLHHLVTGGDFTLPSEAPCVANGAIYYSRSWGECFGYRPWFRFGIGDAGGVVQIDDASEPLVARWVDGRAVAIDEKGRWWVAKAAAGPFVRLQSPALESNGARTLEVSRKFGLVLVNSATTGHEVYRVTVPKLTDQQMDDLYTEQLHCIPEDALIYHGRAYRAMTGGWTFEQAQAQAERRGARLMEVTSAEDLAFLNRMTHHNHKPPAWWIGLQSDGVQHELLDGSEAPFTNFDPAPTPQGAMHGVVTHGAGWTVGKPKEQAGCVLEWDEVPVMQAGKN